MNEYKEPHKQLIDPNSTDDKAVYNWSIVPKQVLGLQAKIIKKHGACTGVVYMVLYSNYHSLKTQGVKDKDITALTRETIYNILLKSYSKESIHKAITELVRSGYIERIGKSKYRVSTDSVLDWIKRYQRNRPPRTRTGISSTR